MPRREEQQTLPGTTLGTYVPAYGGRPAIPAPGTTTRRALEETVGLFPEIEDIGARTAEAMWQQYTGRLPGYTDMAEQASRNIMAALRGELPTDVIRQIGQRAAERGVTLGIPGSQLSTADYLRALGLTSLQMQQWGQQALSEALQRGRGAPLFDISQLFVTPEQQYQAQLAANIMAAAPEPYAAQRAAKEALAGGMRAGMAAARGPYTPPMLIQPGGQLAALEDLFRRQQATFAPQPQGIGWRAPDAPYLGETPLVLGQTQLTPEHWDFWYPEEAELLGIPWEPIGSALELGYEAEPYPEWEYTLGWEYPEYPEYDEYEYSWDYYEE